MNQFEKEKTEIVNLIGQKKYDEEISVLKKIEEQDAKVNKTF